MKNLGICIVIGLSFTVLVAPSTYAVGARPMSMGGAFIAVANDANATYWNPAGLTQLEVSEFTYSPTVYNRDEYYIDDFVGFVTPISLAERNLGSLGLSLINAGYDYSPWWESMGRWYWLSYGIKLFDNLSLGTNLRLENFELEIVGLGSDEDETFGVDLALLWKLEKFSFGILWQNINEPELELFGFVEYKYESNLRTAIAFRPDDKTIIALDMYDATGETETRDQDLRVGIERWFTENFALRAGGYNFNSDLDTRKAVTFGVGLKGSPKQVGFLSSAQLDYCLIYWTDPAPSRDEFTHQVGLTFKF